MGQAPKNPRHGDPAALVLGYLNFSSGAFDPAAWRAMNELFAAEEPAGDELPDAAARVHASLTRALAAVSATESAFRDAGQARAVLDIVFTQLLPAYRGFHADLLEHQPPGAIERPFFVMAAAQAVLACDGPWDDAEDVVRRAIGRLNDYVGWRPLAVLENGRLSEPYPHERVHPVPLFVQGIGAAHGRYRRLVEDAIGILGEAPEGLLRQADFELVRLEELAIDPRAFDFLHPAASRPNYLFGLWDPARIDTQGFYRRMVVQQATLDGILSWADAAATDHDTPPPPRSELARESAAVLAGVMLMASGLCGHGPGGLAAGLGLGDLLPRIASYRDEFYRWLMTRLPDDHRRRLEEENRRMRQPFGGVRRHINGLLAGRRARQVESVALAGTLARLGRADAAERMAGLVPAASARMAARITSRVVAAERALRRRTADGRPAASAAAVALDELDIAVALLLRAVDCGAVVDPWNILGLGGQFPLHEAGGESVTDPRVNDLVALTGAILDGYAAAWRQASAAGTTAAVSRAAVAIERLGNWWDRFATTAVSGVPYLSGREVLDTTREVIEALARRRETTPLPAPPGFWRREVAAFSTPRAHAQAADALLQEGDLDGALGLLVHWASLLEGAAIGRSGSVWLEQAARWLEQASADRSPDGRTRVRKFLELIEANAGGAAEVIEAAAVGREPGDDRRAGRRGADDESDDEPADGDQADGDERGEESVASAYESMVWRDSADDGIDGGMLDMDGAGNATLGGVAAVEEAAEFATGIFGLVREAVVRWCASDAADGTRPAPAEIDAVRGWRHALRRLRRVLVRAAGAVAGRDAAPPPGMSPTEFDKLRWQRDAAAERLIEAAVQAGETLWMLSARLQADRPPRPPRPDAPLAREKKGVVGRLFAAIFAGDAAAVRRHLTVVRSGLVGKHVLYVPLSRGGLAGRIVAARGRERLLERLAACLPRLGLVAETADVVQVAKSLESTRPRSSGAGQRGAASVSEFDRVFEAATQALVERIVVTASAADAAGVAPTDRLVKERILEGLSALVPRLLDTWTTHARQLRLSVLERVRDDVSFGAVREFVERYGPGLFTQQMLAPPSLRGILRGGVRRFLAQLVDRAAGEAGDPDPADGTAGLRRPTRLIEDLSSGALPMKQAAARLRLILEAVAENHAEYRDWNSTTTQSDRGECLHMLLEFLRIKAEHERIAWTLRPVSMAHRVLTRCGAVAAAAAWRGRMQSETEETATALAARLTRLESQSGVRLASVSDRVRRPFTLALEQDELESLVDPAVEELFTGTPAGAGERLEDRAASFLGVASGSGVEVPAWLDRLGEAVDAALERADTGRSAGRPSGRLPEAVTWTPLPWDDLRTALVH